MLVRVVPFVAFGVLVVIGVLVVLGSAAAAPGDTVADRVFGQVGLNGIGCNQMGPTPNPGDTFPTSASTLCHSRGVAIDSGSHLYIVDQDHHRVLEYDNPLTDTVADRVFGQGGSFTSGTCNLGGVSASSLCNPTGVAVDAAGRLYIADLSNSRVLEYDSPLTSQVANRVFGQGGSFTNGPAGGTCNVGGTSASSLCFPGAVGLDAAGRLYIGDGARVLEYESPLTSDVADRVLGQGGSFTTGTCNGINASSLCGPGSVAFDAAGHLYVSDPSNHRVLEFDSPMTSSTANRVYGTGGSFTVAGDCEVVSASSLCQPRGVAVDMAGHLYIADLGNSRVLEYENPLNNSMADRVFGQAGSFTNEACNSSGYSAGSLCHPSEVAVDLDDHLYISDWDNSRVLEYDNPLATPTPTPTPTLTPTTPTPTPVVTVAALPKTGGAPSNGAPPAGWLLVGAAAVVAGFGLARRGVRR